MPGTDAHAHHFLESKRLWFRGPEAQDVPLFTKWVNDPQVRRFLLVGRFPLTTTAEQGFVSAHSGASSPVGPRSDVALTFGFKGQQQAIGNTGLHGIDWVNRSCEWGILIGDPANWGKGLGREVAAAMLEYAFKTINLNRVQLRAYMANVGGIKAYKAAGFVHEGIARQAGSLDGQPADMVLMSVLRADWLKHTNSA